MYCNARAMQHYSCGFPVGHLYHSLFDQREDRNLSKDTNKLLENTKSSSIT